MSSFTIIIKYCDVQILSLALDIPSLHLLPLFLSLSLSLFLSLSSYRAFYWYENVYEFPFPLWVMNIEDTVTLGCWNKSMVVARSKHHCLSSAHRYQESIDEELLRDRAAGMSEAVFLRDPWRKTRRTCLVTPWRDGPHHHLHAQHQRPRQYTCSSRHVCVVIILLDVVKCYEKRCKRILFVCWDAEHFVMV